MLPTKRSVLGRGLQHRLVLMDDYPPLCAGAMCLNEECCDLCPFVGSWQSTNVFGGDLLVVLEAPGRDSGYEVQIANMPQIAFGFVIERTAESTAECQCKIMLDTLTIAAGESPRARRLLHGTPS